MKKFIITLISIFLIIACGSTDNTNKNNTTSNSTITAVEYQKMLGVGIDVDWAKTPTGREAALEARAKGVNVPKLFKERGFSHVRIRVKDDILTDDSLLNEIEALVDESLEANLIPIVAYQAGEFKENPHSDDSLNHVKKWWQKLATRLKDKDYKVAYDLVIENTGEVKKANDRLNLLYKEVTEAIRDIDNKRIIIVAPNKISNPYELDNLEVPTPTDYIMVEWHFYAAGPKKDNPKKQWTTGTNYEKSLITNKIDYAKAWSAKTGIPTWVGAWMVNNYNDINQEATYSDGAPAGGDYSIKEQKEFAKFMVKSLKSANIPYAINSDTKYFNRDENIWYSSVSNILDIILDKK